MTNTETTVATSPAHLMELFARRAAVGDVDAVMDLYETDAVFEPQFGVALAGHDQIRPAIAEFLTLKPQITFTGEPDIVVTGDIALVSNVWAMSAVAPDGSAVADGGTSADVVRRQANGSWKILIDQPRGSAVA